MRRPRTFRTHAQYIASFPPTVRLKLKELHRIVRESASGATECIKYGIAAFELDGPLVYVAGFKNHVSFYPTSSGIRAFRKELSRYKTSTGTVQFRLDEPLPVNLLKRIVRYRLTEVSNANLDSAFHILSRPAQRALIREGLLSPSAVASKTKEQLLKLHGLGPSSLPKIQSVLKARKLRLG
jgi:uncharacterized protein YdhG (YjbR/CyaY superfamily)